MFRIWLLRGCALAVVAVLLGAWASGVVGHGDSPSPAAQVAEPDRAGDPPAMTRVQPGGVLEKARHRHHRKAHRSEQPTPESTPSASDDPTTEAPAPSTPSDTPHTPDSPDPSQPSHPSDHPSQSNPPPDDPSQTPSEPSDDCSTVLDCVLDPITGGP